MNESKPGEKDIGSLVVEFLISLEKESDRGYVLLAASYIDEALAALLRLKLQAMSGASKKELDMLLKSGPSYPLGSYSVRVRMAAAMALIDKPTATALAKLAKIRNEFAHQTGPAELTDQRVSAILHELNEPVEKMAEHYTTAAAEIAEQRAKIIQAGKQSGLQVFAAIPFTPERIKFGFAAGALYGNILNAKAKVARGEL